MPHFEVICMLEYLFSTQIYLNMEASLLLLVVLSMLALPASSFHRIPHCVRATKTFLLYQQPGDFPITGTPLGEQQRDDNDENIVKEHISGLNADASGILLSDVSDYGIRLALAEEHIALGDVERAEVLAREAMQISDHVRQPDSPYHAYAEGA